MRPALVRSLLVLLPLLGMSSTARAAPFTFTQIDVPGALGTAAYGMNDAGQIVGTYADADSPECVTTFVGCRGFLLDSGAFTSIDVPGAATTFGQGVNDDGKIVGFFGRDAGEIAGGMNHGFLLDAGVFTQIDAPGTTTGQVFTSALSINDRGQIWGTFDDDPEADLTRHGFLLEEEGGFTRVDPPGSTATSHGGINDGGQIVGVFLDAGGAFHGFLLDGGAFTQFDVPGAVDTSAEGINDRGQIVGQLFTDRPGQPRGFLLDDGVFTPIDVPGAIYTIADDINDRGQIVGQFQDAQGVIHGFLATPVPEPPALALLTLAALAVLGYRQRRRHTGKG